MKYKNAKDVLPQEFIELIQEYVQGEYIYIPIKDKSAGESDTAYKTELEKRDLHIYTRYLEGVSNVRLAQIYHLSESSIRRIIIKQRKRYETMKEKIREILTAWGLGNSEVKLIYDTTWQVEDQYVLKAYDSLEMLERNLKVLQVLEKMNIPVGKIVLTHDKTPYVQQDEAYYFLSEKLSGKNIIYIGNDLGIASRMGEIIADLHLAFKQCEVADTFWNNSLLEEMNGWVKENFEKSGWSCITKAEYEKVVARLAECYGELPVQLIHRDVHFGNFLFANGEFSGYIDFDLSQRNIRIFDLCYFLLGLLSEKEKFEITEELWFDFLKKAFMGYESKISLSEAEKNAVPYVMECIELLFVSYFESVDNLRFAESAYKIFSFIQKQENRIWKSVR